MKPMPIDAAIAIVSFAGWSVCLVSFCWIVANCHSNRIAFWLARIGVWIAGAGIGYLIAWAIYSLIVGGAQ